MRWQVYRLARLVGKVVRFQHRGTHWWAAPLYQKQRNRFGLNNWLDCLASWYTPNLIRVILTSNVPTEELDNNLSRLAIWSADHGLVIPKKNALNFLIYSKNTTSQHYRSPSLMLKLYHLSTLPNTSNLTWSTQMDAACTKCLKLHVLFAGTVLWTSTSPFYGESFQPVLSM